MKYLLVRILRRTIGHEYIQKDQAKLADANCVLLIFDMLYKLLLFHHCQQYFHPEL